MNENSIKINHPAVLIFIGEAEDMQRKLQGEESVPCGSPIGSSSTFQAVTNGLCRRAAFPKDARIH